MPVGAGQGNWMLSCHSATRIARHFDSQARVRSTTYRRAGWVLSPDWSNFSSPIRRICGWYPASATVRRPVGLSYPLSKHRFWTPSGRSTTMLSSVGLRSFVSWTLAPATTTLSGPPSPSTRTLFLLPALPRSVGLRPIAPLVAQNAPSPWSNRRTAIPSLRRPTPGIPLSARPRYPPAPHARPNAGRFGGWCCHSPDPWASGSIGRSYASGR